jgi:hypothetical protein
MSAVETNEREAPADRDGVVSVIQRALQPAIDIASFGFEGFPTTPAEVAERLRARDALIAYTAHAHDSVNDYWQCFDFGGMMATEDAMRDALNKLATFNALAKGFPDDEVEVSSPGSGERPQWYHNAILRAAYDADDALETLSVNALEAGDRETP